MRPSQRIPFPQRLPESLLIQRSKIRSQDSDPAQRGTVRFVIFVFTVLTIQITGCSFFNRVDSEKSKPKALDKVIANQNTSIDANSNKDVRFDGGLLLGNTDNVAYQPNELSSLFVELIETEKWSSARSLIGLYPDVILKILLGEGKSSLTQPQLIALARLFDQKWQGSSGDSWESFTRSSQKDAAVIGFLESRQAFLLHVGNNQPKEALELNLVSDLESGQSQLAIAEAARLEGIAYLMLEEYPNSIERLSQSVNLLKQSHPYQASKVGLLLGEAQRHAGRHEQWKASWNDAIAIQSRWINDRRLMDPEFWKKAAFLRPVSTPWPASTIRQLEIGLGDTSLEFGAEQTLDNEAVIWATVGVQCLKRHESQNAILALKKSEALIASRSLKDELQMQQALAMIDGGQPGPASAILLRLSSTDRLIGDRAQAILATLKLQNGSLAQGMNLLQSAIKTCNQWPRSERLRAQADYGLSYLMRGREEQGIALLNHVHEKFIAIDDIDQANQCLWNIATYYKQTDQTSEYRAALKKLKEMESL